MSDNYGVDFDIEKDLIDEPAAMEKLQSEARTSAGPVEDNMVADIAEEFVSYYMNDDEWDWPSLIRRYIEADRESEQRRIMDGVFVNLTGFSLAHIIDKVLKREMESDDG